MVKPIANPTNGKAMKRTADSTFDKKVTSLARFMDKSCLADVCGIFINKQIV